MKLTLLSQQTFNSIVLPEKYAGRYWVRGKNAAEKMTDIVAAEALRSTESGGASQWILKSNRRFKITGFYMLQMFWFRIYTSTDNFVFNSRFLDSLADAGTAS